MKLAVSNIAWAKERFGEGLALLRALGCEGVELAPSVIWPEPVDVSAAERRRVARQIQGAALELVGFHALLFTRPNLQFFESRESLEKTASYLLEIGRLCADMGGRVMTLGSPRNRSMKGRDKDLCWTWAAEALGGLSEELVKMDVALCIEPLPGKDTDFISSSQEGWDLVQRINRPGFQLQLDAKALSEMGESVEGALAIYGPHLRHFHAGDPGLAPPGSTGLDHRPFGEALRRSGYPHYVSIEMRRGAGPDDDVITRSVRYVRECYFGGSL